LNIKKVKEIQGNTYTFKPKGVSFERLTSYIR